jgi:hypothetical protein
LDVSADKLLCVLFQDGVDLVEEVVDVLGDLGVALGDLRVGFGGGAGVDVLVAAGLSGLRLTAGVTSSQRVVLLNIAC